MSEQKFKKLYQILLIFAVGLIVLGRLFKIQHYPYSSEITIIGLIIASILLGYQLLSKKDRKIYHYIGVFIVLLLLLTSIMRVIQFSYLKESTIVLFILGGIYAVCYLYEKNKKEKLSKIIKSNAIMILGSTSIILGALLKIQHFPGSAPLFLLGLILLGLSFINESFRGQ